MNGRCTILVADDIHWLREKWMGKRLQREGFKTILVEDVHGLLKEGAAADVLAVDARLSVQPYKFEGIDAVVELVVSGQVKPSVPIIFISTLDENDALSLSQLPILRTHREYCWLTRPFELDFFIKIVRELLTVKS